MIEIVWKLDVWLHKFCFSFYLFIFPSSLINKSTEQTKRREQDEKEFAVWVNLSAGGRQ